MSLYRGFSTDNRLRKYRLTDFDLCKQDLFNHFRIRKGEKLMNPEFGTIIWSAIFDPLTAEIQELIVEDITKIVKYDPRLSVGKVVLNEFALGLEVEIELTYIPEDQTDVLKLKFDKNSGTLATGKIV
jgi:phage baseplate assembly protein W